MVKQQNPDYDGEVLSILDGKSLSPYARYVSPARQQHVSSHVTRELQTRESVENKLRKEK